MQKWPKLKTGCWKSIFVSSLFAILVGYKNETGDAKERIRRTILLMKEQEKKEDEKFGELYRKERREFLFGNGTVKKRVKITKGWSFFLYNMFK